MDGLDRPNSSSKGSTWKSAQRSIWNTQTLIYSVSRCVDEIGVTLMVVAVGWMHVTPIIVS